jgi:hypothetical protein
VGLGSVYSAVGNESILKRDRSWSAPKPDCQFRSAKFIRNEMNPRANTRRICYARNEMSITRYKASFTDSDATEHGVEAEAKSLYDTVGLAIARFHGAPSELLCVSPLGISTALG